jgi:hypothetical protein
VKSPCTHLLDYEWSRERAVAVVWVKCDLFPVKLLEIWILGKVYEYKYGPVDSKKT